MFSILIENAALNDFVELKITNASATDFFTYRRSDVGSIVMLPSTEKKPDSLISKINILMLKSANLHFYIPDEIADDVYGDMISVTAWKSEMKFFRLHEVEDEVEDEVKKNDKDKWIWSEVAGEYIRL